MVRFTRWRQVNYRANWRGEKTEIGSGKSYGEMIPIRHGKQTHRQTHRQIETRQIELPSELLRVRIKVALEADKQQVKWRISKTANLSFGELCSGKRSIWYPFSGAPPPLLSSARATLQQYHQLDGKEQKKDKQQSKRKSKRTRRKIDRQFADKRRTEREKEIKTFPPAVLTVAAGWRTLSC